MSTQCRTDGRCQYAIDSGAEGLGHCPKGKCVLPAPDGEVLGQGRPDWPEDLQTFAERKAYQRGVRDARMLARETAPAPSGYAYRYRDGIRFNNGCLVNGSKPIEAIPYYFDTLFFGFEEEEQPLIAGQLDDFMYHGFGASQDNADIKRAFMSLGLPEKMVNDIMARIVLPESKRTPAGASNV